MQYQRYGFQDEWGHDDWAYAYFCDSKCYYEFCQDQDLTMDPTLQRDPYRIVAPCKNCGKQDEG